MEEKGLRFLGNIEVRADSKGRAFLPAVFRKVLQNGGVERLVMRKDIFQPCLVLYPENVWSEQMDLLRIKLSRWDASQQQVFRQFVSQVEAVELDSNGRILLPKRHRHVIEPGKLIRFIGMGDTIEIWDGASTEAPFMEPSDFVKAIENLMSRTEDNIL